MVDTVTSGAEGARKAVARKRLKETGWKRCPVKDRNRSETATKHNPNTGRQAGRQAGEKCEKKTIINHVHVVQVSCSSWRTKELTSEVLRPRP